MVQSNHRRSTNKIVNATEKVTEESLFNTLQSLNTREHPIKKCNGWVCDKEKEVPFHRKVIGLRSSFLLVETQSPNRLQRE